MSQQTVTSYNPEAIMFVLDGARIEGLGEDGISIELTGDHEVIEGMDGGMTMNFDPSRMATVSVTLRAASLGAKRIRGIYDAWEASPRAGGGVNSLSGVARDPVNGTAITSGEVFFRNRVMPSFSRQAGEVTWEFSFCNYESITAARL